MTNDPFYISPLESSSDDADSEIIEGSSNDSLDDDDESASYYTDHDDYSLDSTDELICEQILHDESAHMYEDKTDKKYYIGTVYVIDDMILIANSISSVTFFRHRFIDVQHYLWAYSIVMNNRSVFDIMQLNISSDGVYKVVIKTFWLRIVQRTWKRIFRERQEMWRKRMSLAALRSREISGKYPLGIRVLPTIHGMV